MLAGVYVSSVFLGWDYHIWVMQIALGPWQVGWLYLVNQWRLYEENSDLYIFSENVLERLTELTNWHKNIDFTQCIGIQHVLIICLFFERMFLKAGGQILLQSITWDIWGVEFSDIFRRNEIYCFKHDITYIEYRGRDTDVSRRDIGQTWRKLESLWDIQRNDILFRSPNVLFLKL